jgi:hypothetical protein
MGIELQINFTLSAYALHDFHFSSKKGLAELTSIW